MAVVDRTGQRFARLTATTRGPDAPGGQSRWWCDCDCGARVLVSGHNLQSGHTRSCGCLRRGRLAAYNTTHGYARRGALNPLYHTWQSMRQRCSNPNDRSYPYYGARGITVFDPWSKFERFLADVGERPGPGYELDRIKNDGPYSPSNTQWLSRAEHRAKHALTNAAPAPN
jgi:hypothetical protein